MIDKLVKTEYRLWNTHTQTHTHNKCQLIFTKCAKTMENTFFSKTSAGIFGHMLRKMSLELLHIIQKVLEIGQRSKCKT